jgi:hypothetical protein
MSQYKYDLRNLTGAAFLNIATPVKCYLYVLHSYKGRVIAWVKEKTIQENPQVRLPSFISERLFSTQQDVKSTGTLPPHEVNGFARSED